MRCKTCDAPMLEEKDPYGTGHWWYVLYEPTCDCEEKPARYNGQTDDNQEELP